MGRRRVIGWLLPVVVVTAVVWTTPRGAAGQGPGPAAASPAYTPPRMANGQPNLEGVWRTWNHAQYDVEDHTASWGVPPGLGVVDGGEIPYQPWAAMQRAENFENSRTSEPLETADPLGKCYLPGVPRITYLGFPFQITQLDDRLVVLYEWRHVRRVIYLNDEPSVFDGVDLWMGTSRGRFDGSTLVVTARNLSSRTWLDAAGNFHSEALQVEERYTPLGPNTMRYEATLDDPTVFTRPWTMRMLLHRQTEIGLLEYECHALLKERGVPLTWPREW